MNEKSIHTGFKDLDNALGGGLKEGEVFFVASRPGVGKTTLAINILSSIAKSGSSCGFFSLEFTEQVIKNKYKNLDINRINIYDDSAYSIEQIAAICKSYSVNNKKLDVIAIDYIQLLNNVWDDITAIYNSLKALAQELNICVIVLSQVGRTLQEYSTITDLKEFYPFALKSDKTIILNRPDILATKDELAKGLVKKGQTILTIYKNGGEITGKVSLLFDSDNLRFYDFNN
jgi:replicative DNA helicase